MVTVRALLTDGRARLRAAGLESPSREAALLLRHLLGMSEAALLARDRDPVAPAVADRFRALLDLRARGVPAAHLVGEREFWGRRFAVDSRVLVPRPETEHLIEIALELPLGANACVVDIGTGSGCLAVTLQAERPSWRVVATDLSPAALAVARKNALRILGRDRLSLVGCDLGTALRLEAFDLVVANPPYVDAAAEAALPVDVREFEPRVALYPPGHAL
ncbi:MAG TPA: HemK/PrmC family methyltransferase, partial [Thermoanaerobaculia bacterium]|nr:HemK/PrmC family methyltransferase [Thermoanaerobaculia bacterium]